MWGTIQNYPTTNFQEFRKETMQQYKVCDNRHPGAENNWGFLKLKSKINFKALQICYLFVIWVHNVLLIIYSEKETNIK